jgi:hypothetical protein
MTGPVELLRHQSPIPAEYGVRLGNECDILQGFASWSLGDLGQNAPLGIRQAEPGREVCSEDPILSHQVLVAERQLLVDESGHKGQKACPLESVAHGRRSS